MAKVPKATSFFERAMDFLAEHFIEKLDVSEGKKKYLRRYYRRERMRLIEWALKDIFGG